MKIRSILLSLSAVVLFTSVSFASSAVQQSRERVIRRLPIEKNEPIGITSVKVNDRAVLSNQKFVADDDWLRGLVISVRNKTDKLILYASIQLQFPRPVAKERFSIFDMSYGNRGLPQRPPTPSEKLVGLAPGETVDIVLSSEEFATLRQFLTGTGYPPSIKTMDLRIDQVIFEDDTMWSGGTSLRRDPKDPGTWINVELTGLR